MSEYYLAHAGRSKRDGAKIGSGRYPLGSGDRPYQATGGEKPRSKNSRRRPDLSGKTDAEMREAVQRENLEQTYAKVFDLIEKDNDPVSIARQYANVSKDTVKALQKLERETRQKSNPPLDLSKMSDDEMRQKINRANLERQYNEMFNKPTVSKGRARVQKALAVADTVTDIATPFAIVGATVATILLKKKGLL